MIDQRDKISHNTIETNVISKNYRYRDMLYFFIVKGFISPSILLFNHHDQSEFFSVYLEIFENDISFSKVRWNITKGLSEKEQAQF